MLLSAICGFIFQSIQGQLSLMQWELSWINPSFFNDGVDSTLLNCMRSSGIYLHPKKEILDSWIIINAPVHFLPLWFFRTVSNFFNIFDKHWLFSALLVNEDSGIIPQAYLAFVHFSNCSEKWMVTIDINFTESPRRDMWVIINKITRKSLLLAWFLSNWW